MSVYVDDMYKHPMGSFRRMKMSHMIADTDDELHAMADRIGVARKWYQGDHYDIAMSKRDLAIQYGAVAVTLKQLACMSGLRKRGLPMGPPDTAIERRVALSRARTMTAEPNLEPLAKCPGDCIWVKDRLPPDYSTFLKCVVCEKRTHLPEAGHA